MKYSAVLGRAAREPPSGVCREVVGMVTVTLAASAGAPANRAAAASAAPRSRGPTARARKLCLIQFMGTPHGFRSSTPRAAEQTPPHREIGNDRAGRVPDEVAAPTSG